VARGGLYVVDGDGTNDRGLAPDPDLGPIAWRPGDRFQLAYLAAGELRLQDADSGRVMWRANAGSPFTPIGLSWSSDGQRIAVAFAREIVVFDARGRKLRRIEFLRSELTAVSFAPSGHQLGVLLRTPGTVTAATRSSLRLVDANTGARGRELFAGQGDFGELAWSPNGRYLLVAWRSADRWLFVNRATRYAIAVENISPQFPRPDGRPALLFVADRWCCAG
jgi:Tol biopolymer transport system component